MSIAGQDVRGRGLHRLDRAKDILVFGSALKIPWFETFRFVGSHFQLTGMLHFGAPTTYDRSVHVNG